MAITYGGYPRRDARLSSLLLLGLERLHALIARRQALHDLSPAPECLLARAGTAHRDIAWQVDTGTSRIALMAVRR